jgi:hypothetical protein
LRDHLFPTKNNAGIREVTLVAVDITVKKVFNNIPEVKRFIEKKRKSWFDEAENDLQIMDVRCWRKIAR